MTTKHPAEQLKLIFVIGIGGFAGSTLRYFIELLVPNSLLATVLVNVIGCFALGFVFYQGFFSNSFSRAGQTLLTTGVIASFTTYSTFIVDVALATPLIGVLYIGSSYLLGFLAVIVGRMAAKQTANRWSDFPVVRD